MNVSKAISSWRSPRRMREPAVSQKIAIVEKCSQPSLPRGNRFSNSSRLRPSCKVRHHFRASRTESERKMSIRVSRTWASCFVGRGMDAATARWAYQPLARGSPPARSQGSSSAYARGSPTPSWNRPSSGRSPKRVGSPRRRTRWATIPRLTANAHIPPTVAYQYYQNDDIDSHADHDDPGEERDLGA